MPKPKGGGFNQDNRDWIKLNAAKKAAEKVAPKPESWWASPNLSRDEFYSRAAHRHRQILNSASDGTRSLTKAI